MLQGPINPTTASWPEKGQEMLMIYHSIPQHSECASPLATFENRFFFRRRIAKHHPFLETL